MQCRYLPLADKRFVLKADAAPSAERMAPASASLPAVGASIVTIPCKRPVAHQIPRSARARKGGTA